MLGDTTGLLGAMKVNEKIKVFREMKELTQEDMANKLSLSTNGYANIERGETKLSVERLEQIANILEIDVTELLAFGENSSITYTHLHSPNTQNLTIFGNASNDMLELEISKLQLIINHKDELISNKDILLTEVTQPSKLSIQQKLTGRQT